MKIKYTDLNTPTDKFFNLINKSAVKISSDVV